ncbi:hypothetical protein [Amycolatopsis sp. WGS_07]|uniref:hypothetical protein n=1 Tax=Amycolatopsis sp. WGS_07 TaxID=3076764 RepID=UPI003873C1F3
MRCGGVVLDVMVPVLDGLDNCRVLRAEGDFVPILMLTARTAELRSLATMEAMAADTMALPHLAIPGRTGWLYPPGKTEVLVNACWN